MTAPSKYGIRWSQGISIAGIVAVAVWGPIYNFLDDQYAERWWYNFAIAFVIAGAVVTLSWLTCAIAEYLEKRDRVNAGAQMAQQSESVSGAARDPAGG